MIYGPKEANNFPLINSQFFSGFFVRRRSNTIRYFMQSLIELQAHLMIYICVLAIRRRAGCETGLCSFLVSRKTRTSDSGTRSCGPRNSGNWRPPFDGMQIDSDVNRLVWTCRRAFGMTSAPLLRFQRLTEERSPRTSRHGFNWTCRRSMEQFRVDLDTVWRLIKSLL